jgi:hypothetical protein
MMGLLKALFASAFQNVTDIEEWIQKLAVRDNQCEFLQTTSFETLAKFMADRRAQVLSSGEPYPDESVLYRVSVRGRLYDVRVSRAIYLHGILLTSELSTGS